MRFNVDSGAMVYRIHADTEDNPFSGGLFSQFRLTDAVLRKETGMSNDALIQTIVTGSDPRNLPEFIAIREGNQQRLATRLSRK